MAVNVVYAKPTIQPSPRKTAKYSRTTFGGRIGRNRYHHNNNSASMQHGCPKCQRLYYHRRSMITHLKYECGKPPAYECIECDYKSKVKGNMKKHLMIKHNLKSDMIQECGALNAKIEID